MRLQWFYLPIIGLYEVLNVLFLLCPVRVRTQSSGSSGNIHSNKCCGLYWHFLHVATVVAVLELGSRYTDRSACILQRGNSKRLQNIYSTMKDTTSELQLRGRLQTKNEEGWRRSIFMIILARFCHSNVFHSTLLNVYCTASSCQGNCCCFSLFYETRHLCRPVWFKLTILLPHSLEFWEHRWVTPRLGRCSCFKTHPKI